jgi:hypothetical protein
VHHHDAAEYLGREAKPRPKDMFENWRFNVDASEPPMIVDEAPWWKRHGLVPPQTIYKLKDIATLGNDGIWRLDERPKLRVPKPLK